MLKWYMEKRREKQKLKVVNRARKILTQYFSESSHESLINVFENSARPHESRAFSLVEMEIGSSLYRLKKLIDELDITLIHSHNEWRYTISSNTELVLNLKYIDDTASTIETISTAMIRMIGYLAPPVNDCTYVEFLPYNFGRHVRNESFTIQ